MIARPLIFDLDLIELEEIFRDWGEPAYRAKQVWQGLYQHLLDEPERFTTLPRSLRLRLSEQYDFSHLQPTQTLASNDLETQKTLFLLPEKQAVEAVIMRYAKRRTLCISTQAGCAMGCHFCATGQMGFQRNLTGGEIIEQVLFYARQLRSQDDQVTNIVMMGMGEPFHNYEATFQAIDRLNHPDGFNFGARRVTISTVGLVPAIRRFTTERRQVNLAVSLHAADDELRSSLLPINRKYPLDMLMDACEDYIGITNRRITFEWALIRGVNDSLEQAHKLAGRLKPFLRSGASLCHVNVIPLNPTQRYSGQATTRQQALDFQAELEKAGFPCTIRLRRGIDIQAGCGQLAIETKARSADG